MHRMLNQDYLVKVKNMRAHSELKFQSSSLCKKFQFHVPVPCSLGRSKTGVPSSLGPYLFFTSVVTYSNGEKNFSFE